MTEGCGPVRAPRRTGNEEVHRGGQPLGGALSDFWAWSVSDLVSNATRGRLAEYIGVRALGLATAGVRDEWAAYDLETPKGVKIEVKSAAYLQAWFQRGPSVISCSPRPSRVWDPQTNLQATERSRQADVYVFALLFHLEKPTLDPIDVA